MEWHSESWEEAYHATVPLVRIFQKDFFCDFEAVTDWFSGKGLKSESSTRVRDSNSISPRVLSSSRLRFVNVRLRFQHDFIWEARCFMDLSNERRQV